MVLIDQTVGSRATMSIQTPTGLATIIGGLLLGSMHVFLALPAYGWVARCMAVLLMVAAIRAMLTAATRDERDIVLVLILIQNYVFYGAAQFSTDSLARYSGVYAPIPAMLEKAMVLVVVSTALLYIGYRIGGWMPLRDRCFEALPPLRASWVYPTNIMISLATGVHVLNTVRPDVIPVSIRLLTLLSLNVYVALAVRLEIEMMRGRNGVPLSVFASIAALSFAGLLQGATGSVVMPWGFLMFWIFLRRRTLDLRVIGAVLLLILLVDPAKNVFRSSQVYQEGRLETSADVQENLGEWRSAFSRAWSGEGAWAMNVRSVAIRLSDLVHFTQVVDLVPETVPYRGIGRLGPAFMFWIPRLVWPDKPGNMDLLYQEFAREFKYMPEEGMGNTRVGASLLSEAYWSAGLMGVCMFSMAVGFILGTSFAPSSHKSWSAIVITAFVAGHSFLPVESLTTLVASILTFLAGTAICIFLIVRLGSISVGRAY